MGGQRARRTGKFICERDLSGLDTLARYYNAKRERACAEMILLGGRMRKEGRACGTMKR